MCGKSLEVDTSSINEWKEERLNLLLSEYAVDISNEASFFEVLSEKTLAYKVDKCV